MTIAVLVGVPVVVTVPDPAGVAHVPSPRQKVEDDALVPLLRFVTGKLPVTPVESGSPTALASVPPPAAFAWVWVAFVKLAIVGVVSVLFVRVCVAASVTIDCVVDPS